MPPRAEDQPGRYQRLNMRQATLVFGFGAWVLRGIKIASANDPNRPFKGRYTTAESLDRWLDEHPEFVASHHIRRRKLPQVG
jgi:hypothetical protein